ncbi:GGDEF domain-containing protein [Cupriavidus necator]|uniref:GGDEF domain-containing protein n=1 Tax=Cupriavidus necator TaxID=106590 RepID=UPI001F48B5D0|nr:GGDEF domain-containing protein [Cupriavidus necator]
MRQALRHTDQLGRFGGEEFVVLMPQTDRPTALATAERLRQAVANQQASDGWPTCTASVGLASVEAGETTLDGVLSRADAALYRAKADGRDRVAVG